MGYVVRGTAANSNCYSPFAPCGMHQFSSFGAQQGRNRPWSPAFGAHPGLYIRTVADPHIVSVSVGAFGYVCPLLQDMTTNSMIEYCFQEWKVGSGFPSIQPDSSSVVCASHHPYNIDQIITHFAPGGRYATQRPGTPNSFVFASGSNPAARTFEATISAVDLQQAIQAVSVCGRGHSTNPADWALVGVERGLEGGGLTLLAGTTSNLYLATTIDTLHENESLFQEHLLVSANGAYAASMQPDGNFVVYNISSGSWVPTWSTGTFGQNGAYIIMQPDGNLVMYRNGAPIWNTGTFSNGKNFLVMQNDGNLVLYSNGVARWSIR
jgi:hypothetical protein